MVFMESQKSWSFHEELLLERISFFNILPSQSYSENIIYSAEELLPKYFFLLNGYVGMTI